MRPGSATSVTANPPGSAIESNESTYSWSNRPRHADIRQPGSVTPRTPVDMPEPQIPAGDYFNAYASSPKYNASYTEVIPSYVPPPPPLPPPPPIDAKPEALITAERDSGQRALRFSVLGVTLLIVNSFRWLHPITRPFNVQSKRILRFRHKPPSIDDHSN